MSSERGGSSRSRERGECSGPSCHASSGGTPTDLVLSDVSESSLQARVDGLPEVGARWRLSWRTSAKPRRSKPSSVGRSNVRAARRADQQCRRAGSERSHPQPRTEDWERAFRVNVLGAVNGIRAAVPVMRTQQSGSIVLTASVSGLTAWSHAAPYCATKAAVIQLAKVAAVEYARDGIRVNCVCPGTFLRGSTPTSRRRRSTRSRPSIRSGSGSAADLVGAYSYLASDASRWTTGSAIVVDGGYAAP